MRERLLCVDELRAMNVNRGSISADPVVDLDGRKQSTSLSGAEADLHGRRDQP
jgi:hypothetical protein